MKIKRVETRKFEPDFLGSGYAMSVGRQTRLCHRLIRLTAEDGTTGIGEFVRPMVYDPDALLEIEDAHLPEIQGVDLADLPTLLSKWRGAGKEFQGFVFGVELAMLDMIGRKMDMPVSGLLGGALAGDVPEYLSLSGEDPDAMAEIVRNRGDGFAVIQAKLGGGDLGTDLARVEAVLGAMTADQLLLADFNGALSREDAIKGLPDVRDPRVIWEEPCSAYEDGAEVARSLSLPVMLDQCLKDLPTYVRAVQDKAAAALVIKSDSIGGLTVGRTVRDLCAACGIKVRVDGWWAGPVAAAGSLHLACGAEPQTLIASIDLTDPIDISRSYMSRPRPGKIAPSAGTGLGNVPRDVFS